MKISRIIAASIVATSIITTASAETDTAQGTDSGILNLSTYVNSIVSISNAVVANSSDLFTELAVDETSGDNASLGRYQATELTAGTMNLFSNDKDGTNVTVEGTNSSTLNILNASPVTDTNNFTNVITVNSVDIDDASDSSIIDGLTQTGVGTLATNQINQIGAKIKLNLAAPSLALLSGTYTQDYTVTLTGL